MICIERLSHRINKAVQSKHWKPIRLSRRGIPITHLFFFLSDDLLLIAEASCDQANGIKKVLNTFCKSSGKKVSSQKTKVFFSKNVQQLEMKKIGEMFGFSVTNDLGNFIRMPISHIEWQKLHIRGCWRRLIVGLVAGMLNSCLLLEELH